jgi:hypothetical protein
MHTESRVHPVKREIPKRKIEIGIEIQINEKRHYAIQDWRKFSNSTGVRGGGDKAAKSSEKDVRLGVE